MKTIKKNVSIILVCFALVSGCDNPKPQIQGLPSSKELNRSFGKHDKAAFLSPAKVYRPETWFHFIGGNVSAEGITADLEAIAQAGFSGVQLFHGQFGGAWPGVTPQIVSLSELWDDVVKHAAEECRRLGLRFTMQNCPGWATAGGPWIEPANAMRQLVWNRTDVEKGNSDFAIAQPQPSAEQWRDYRDIAVIAFPTPLDDTNKPLIPVSIKSNRPELPWTEWLAGTPGVRYTFAPTPENEPYWVEVDFPDVTTVRTIEFSSVNGFSHIWSYEPGVAVTVEAVLDDGATLEVLRVEMPQASWQDDQPISFACNEISNAQTYRISITNKNNMTISSLRLFSAARKNNWQSEAGWTLRSLVRQNDNPQQSKDAFVDPLQIRDISAFMDTQGNIKWDVPDGKWTVLRIGHVNAGRRNSPAPPEATGWECDKLSKSGVDVHFAGYIGRLAGKDGPLANGLLNGMLIDSWECRTQTWTNDMEAEFENISGYALREWFPALFGYVVDDHETTTRFLRDWRNAVGELFSNNFYGRMAKHARDNGLTFSYETAAGDIVPADILEFFKHADIPMCEFWHPMSENYVGSLNFKPVKPTASAARVYGKPRVAAEAFTSFNLTWDEQWDMLKEVANINKIEGVTHFVFHTYTHNPRTDFLPPGTSFGSNIGTPFLRGQTWWKHMPEFTTYLARCTYMLERGKPVSDVLWYLGDEINHKPDQNAPFPEGFKYDYCNPDVLLNRLTVRNGMITTPEGIQYRVLWIPDNPRMLPQTLEKLYSLAHAGATIIGNPPQGLATLSGADAAQQRFDTAVRNIWGETRERGIKNLGKGAIVSGMTIDEALKELKIQPDVLGDALWLHRSIDGADWYYVCAPLNNGVSAKWNPQVRNYGDYLCGTIGDGFSGTLDFRNAGHVEIWDPVTGAITPAEAQRNGERTLVTLDLPPAGSCFVVFRKKGNPTPQSRHCGLDPQSPHSQIQLNTPWTLTFPEGWGAPSSLLVDELKAWKDLDVSDEAKAFSGSVVYTTTFEVGELRSGMCFTLDLGRVAMIAAVSVNGKPLRTLWTPPYSVDVTEAIQSGTNTLTVEVTSSWFNRLVYDAGMPEDQRKTWTIAGPARDRALRESGLIGPVALYVDQKILKK